MPKIARIARGHEGDRTRVPLEPVERPRELAHRQADHEEREPEPERVGDQEQRGARDVVADGREPEHRAEHGTDARLPAEAERGARHRRRHRPEPFEVRVEAHLLVEARAW